MRWPRVRVWILFIYVAAAATAAGAVALHGRSTEFQALSQTHGRLAEQWQAEAARLREKFGSCVGFHGEDPCGIVRAYAKAEHHDALRLKYARAARRPWASVVADPPEPR